MIQRVVALGLLAAVLILPLCLIYASSSVYLKLLLLNTQPLVSFTGRWVVKLSSATTTVTGCSDQRFLQMMPNSRIFAVASRAVDNDHDGYPDIVSVNASTILLPREQILSVRAAFEIEYQVAVIAC